MTLCRVSQVSPGGQILLGFFTHANSKCSSCISAVSHSILRLLFFWDKSAPKSEKLGRDPSLSIDFVSDSLHAFCSRTELTKTNLWPCLGGQFKHSQNRSRNQILNCRPRQQIEISRMARAHFQNYLVLPASFHSNNLLNSFIKFRVARPISNNL